MKLSPLSLLGALASMAILFTACQRNTEAASAAADAAAGGVSGTPASFFTVPADQMSHVQVAPAKLTDWPDVLRLPGAVDYDQFETTPVISAVGGPVASVEVIPGQMVQKGQVLLEVASPDFAQARDIYVKAKDADDLADRAYKRAQDLYAHHAIAQADLEAAASALNQAAADLEAAEQTIRILGVPNPGDVTQPSEMAQIPVKAPISGQVVERDVAPGQLLAAGATQCFVLSDMAKVWVLANIYQSDLPYVGVGNPVEIDTGAYAQHLDGKIQFISPAMDPATHTLQARIEVDNPRGELKKDMFVTATVRAGTLAHIVVVPDAAVLRDDQNNPFVYVAKGNRQFAQQAVRLGQSQDGFTQVTSGLEAGTQVVGDGSLFLQFATTHQQ